MVKSVGFTEPYPAQGDPLQQGEKFLAKKKIVLVLVLVLVLENSPPFEDEDEDENDSERRATASPTAPALPHA